MMTFLFSVRLYLLKQMGMILEGDKSCAALEGQVGPGPLEHDQETVTKAYEVEDVDAQPHGPGNEAGETDGAHIDNSIRAYDGCQVSIVEIMEWSGRRGSSHSLRCCHTPGNH